MSYPDIPTPSRTVLIDGAPIPTHYDLVDQNGNKDEGDAFVLNLDPDGHVYHMNNDGTRGTDDAKGTVTRANLCTLNKSGEVATFVPVRGQKGYSVVILQTNPL